VIRELREQHREECVIEMYERHEGSGRQLHVVEPSSPPSVLSSFNSLKR
jgi:hypothetical protein